jgi:hypothetical protein
MILYCQHGTAPRKTYETLDLLCLSVNLQQRPNALANEIPITFLVRIASFRNANYCIWRSAQDSQNTYQQAGKLPPGNALSSKNRFRFPECS